MFPRIFNHSITSIKIDVNHKSFYSLFVKKIEQTSLGLEDRREFAQETLDTGNTNTRLGKLFRRAQDVWLGTTQQFKIIYHKFTRHWFIIKGKYWNLKNLEKLI